MKFTLCLTCLLCCLMSSTAFSRETVIPLKLYKVYNVEGPEDFEPSGLTIMGGRVYTVCDNHDRFIYYLELNNNNDTATASPHLEIPLPSFSFFESYDFEGVTHDMDGNFFLASEAQSRILRVSGSGDTADWITPDLTITGKPAGLFQVHNAGLEGICRLSDHSFLLCAERQPRGFVEIHLSENPVQVRAWRSDTSKFEFPESISSDFSGLYRYKNDVYVLERNAFLITRLEPDNDRLMETTGWSYRHVETAPPCRYADMTYGKAEGLCIDDNYIYIIIDNNGDPRERNPDDRRPLLMVFHHPDNF